METTVVVNLASLAKQAKKLQKANLKKWCTDTANWFRAQLVSDEVGLRSKLVSSAEQGNDYYLLVFEELPNAKDVANIASKYTCLKKLVKELRSKRSKMKFKYWDDACGGSYVKIVWAAK